MKESDTPQTFSEITVKAGNPARIVQVVTGLAPRDGISGILIEIDRTCRRLGYKSEICARTIENNFAPLMNDCDPSLLRFRRFAEEALHTPTVFIYHFGVEDAEIEKVFEQYPHLDKVFYYHNITPAIFYRYWNQVAFDQCILSRKVLLKILQQNWIITGDSWYNIDEVSKNQKRVLPPVLPLAGLNLTEILAAKAEKSSADVPTLLFVGRFAPGKRQHLLVYAIRRLKDLGLPCQLILAGKATGPYFHYVQLMIRVLKLQKHITTLRDVDAAELSSLYDRANYFVAATEHEGFCLPIFEAMKQGCLPIVRPFAAVQEFFHASHIIAPKKSVSSFVHTIESTLLATFKNPVQYSKLFFETAATVQKELDGYLSVEDFLNVLNQPGSNIQAANRHSRKQVSKLATRENPAFTVERAHRIRGAWYQLVFVTIELARKCFLPLVLSGPLKPFFQRLQR